MKDCFKNFKNRLQDSLQICNESTHNNANTRDTNNEKRGIYNVTFNDKKSTAIKTDLELIEEAIIQEVIMYVKGYQDMRRDKGMGAEHIKIHLEENSEGQITIEELLNLGNSIREYLKVFDEPFIDQDGRKIYEWQDDKGVRFRLVSDTLSQKGLEKTIQTGGSQLPLSPSEIIKEDKINLSNFDNTIITFYSDRNLKDKMQFKNPQVEQYYQEIQRKRRKP